MKIDLPPDDSQTEIWTLDSGKEVKVTFSLSWGFLIFIANLSGEETAELRIKFTEKKTGRNISSVQIAPRITNIKIKKFIGHPPGYRQ